MLQLAGQSGARSAVLDYASTFDDRLFNTSGLEGAVSESLRLEWSQYSLHRRASQIATLLEGVKLYARTITTGSVNKPLHEIIIALDVHAYAVWSGNATLFKPHVQFDPPTAHFTFHTKRVDIDAT